MALRFVRCKKGPWTTATALDRQRNEPLDFNFDEYPDDWPQVEAWDIVDDAGERRYDMILVPNGGYIWKAGSAERVARVVQDWLSLEEKPDVKLERELVIALLEARKKKANQNTILATIAFDEKLAL